MNNLLDINELINPNIAQLDIIPTLFSFFICVLMSFIVRDFYIKRSFSLTGKMHIGSIIPVLSTVVFLVIVVVKSSLALSLGLVGALSIVRFRTPIKEPEELVYLFLAIAIGLGYGAGQVDPGLAAAAGIGPAAAGFAGTTNVGEGGARSLTLPTGESGGGTGLGGTGTNVPGTPIVPEGITAAESAQAFEDAKAAEIANVQAAAAARGAEICQARMFDPTERTGAVR
mgnify:CR=1 FL=1